MFKSIISPHFSQISFNSYNPLSSYQHEKCSLWSPIYWDTTPCFLNSLFAIFQFVFLFIILFYTRYLLRNFTSHPFSPGWHYRLKQSIVSITIVLYSLNGIVSLFSSSPSPSPILLLSIGLTICTLIAIHYLQYVEYTRLPYPNGVSLMYWLTLIIFSFARLYSFTIRHPIDVPLSIIFFFLLLAFVFLSLIELSLELWAPKNVYGYDLIEDEKTCPYLVANIFSILTFSWMTSLMKLGYEIYLSEHDLWNLRPTDTTKYTGDSFAKTWATEASKNNPSLWRALIRQYGKVYFLGSSLKLVSDVLLYVQPQLLALLIKFVASKASNSQSEPLAKGLMISILMFLVSSIQSIVLHQYFGRIFEVAMNIRSALTATIYSKSMRLSQDSRSAQTTGDIVNYMSVDTQRLEDLAQYAAQLWSSPFQIIICLCLLFRLLGYSMFAGVGIMIIMIPVNGFLARFIRRLHQKLMKTKDARTKLTSEILINIKSIKLFAWTRAFSQKLNFIRNDEELMLLKRIGGANAVANFCWSCTPFLVSCVTFTMFVYVQDTPLTIDIVFPALALFNFLTFPLAVFPLVLTSLIEACVAVERLRTFFLANEIQPGAVDHREVIEEPGANSVVMKNAQFSWSKDGPDVVSDINVTANRGKLVCIIGQVGSGKTSLLNGILGELYKRNGQVTVYGSVAYVSQGAWIMNGTLRDNILCGHEFDEEYYDLTINACGLREDLKYLTNGDQTEVGERGLSLSGGQKMRVNLARAVYSRADIYILDDVLAAVDQHVGKHLIKQILGREGLLAKKTRILATNSIPVLQEADFIFMLRNGKIIEQGTVDEVTKLNGAIHEIVRTAGNDCDSTEPDELVEVKAAEETGLCNGDSINDSKAKLITGGRTRAWDQNRSVVDSNAEKSEHGRVKWSVYEKYGSSCGWGAISAYLIVLILAQLAQMGGSVWLKFWAEENGNMGNNRNQGRFVGVYFGLGATSLVLTIAQTVLLWMVISIRASKRLHERLANAILRCPMSFFETTPTGRILNRFSNDIYRIDELLARSMNMLFVQTGRALITLGIISVSVPVFSPLIIPFGFLYHYIQKYYLRTFRELKRLDSISRSPVFAHFHESLNGLSTIRAYRQEQRFINTNAWNVDANLRAYFASINANRWLAVRLEFLGSLIIFIAATLSVISVSMGSKLSGGMVGLAMSYALQITTSLNWIVRQTVDVETNVISVERVLEYIDMPSEAPLIIANNRPPISWPSRGAVKFIDYSTRYRPGLELALKKINMSIEPGEKIGVVGRTGAGKSSLTLALFRIIEAVTGHIEIDGLNTSKLGLDDLRSRLAIIPQDATVFAGSLRDSLDPARVHDDTELWTVLEHARLKDFVASLPDKLDSQIFEDGSNLSYGQRQLLSLARALLTPSRILVLDEATAAVDVQTDALLQTTLRSGIFKERTIITIAHRINTILDCDRIVVLNHGQVVEFDTPEKLVESKGLFYELVRESHLLGSFKGTEV